MPVRVELYEKGDRLRKVIHVPVESVTLDGKVWVPRRVRLDDQVSGSYTELLVDEVETEAKLPRKLFSERALISGGR